MTRPEKILFIDQFSGFGGGQRILLRLIEIALSEGLDVTVMIPGKGPLHSALLNVSQNISIKPYRPPNLTVGKKNLTDAFKIAAYSLWFWVKFRSFINEFKIVYVNSGRLFLPSAFCSIFSRALFIYHVHLVYSGLALKTLALLNWMSRTFAICYSSNFTMQEVFNQLPQLRDSPKSILLACSLSKGESTVPFESRFSNHQSPQAEMTIGIFGRISHEKGTDIIVNLANEFKNCDFILIGDCDFADRQFMENIIRNLPNNAKFLGPTDNLSAAIHQHQIQVSLVPARAVESFGMVAVESMASSCITIVRARGGLIEASQRTGALLFELDFELSHLIYKLLATSAEELEKLARQQFTAAHKHYDWSTFEAPALELLKRAVFAAPKDHPLK